jgi:tellurite methyltransferase
LNHRIELWNQRYRAGEYRHEAPSRLVVEFAGSLPAGSVLDIACGPGRNALYLAGRGWRVTALDGSPVAIDLLQSQALSRGLAVNTRSVDLETGQFNFENAAHDLVLSCYYFQPDLIPGLKSCLKPGGMLIAIAHLADPDTVRQSAGRVLRGNLRDLFDRWSILHYREGEPEERGHRHGVAELVAIKPLE